MTYQERPAQAPATAKPAAPAAPARNLPEPGRRYLMDIASIVPEPVGPRCDEECTCWEWATPEYADADPDLGRRGYGPLQVRVPLMGGARVTGSYEGHAA